MKLAPPSLRLGFRMRDLSTGLCDEVRFFLSNSSSLDCSCSSLDVPTYTVRFCPFFGVGLLAPCVPIAGGSTCNEHTSRASTPAERNNAQNNIAPISAESWRDVAADSIRDRLIDDSVCSWGLTYPQLR